MGAVIQKKTKDRVYRRGKWNQAIADLYTKFPRSSGGVFFLQRQREPAAARLVADSVIVRKGVTMEYSAVLCPCVVQHGSMADTGS